MMRRSVRLGHNDDNATEPPPARAIRLRATRPSISVEIRLRCDTPCLGREDSFRLLLIRKCCQDTTLKGCESAQQAQKPVQNQDLAVQFRRTSLAPKTRPS